MSDLSALIERTLKPKEAQIAHDNATEQQLRAGRGLQRRDMTPEERHQHDLAKQRKRARQYRAQQGRASEAKARDRKEVQREALREALDVTSILSDKIDLVAQRRARKAARLLGSIAEDATFDTYKTVNRSIAGAIYRDERPKDELLTAAEWLSQQPGIPTVGFEAPPHSKWLMSVIEYRSRSAIKEWYEREPSIESLAQGDSAIASTYYDDYYDRFCADGQPAVAGARWPRPGQIDMGIVQAIMAGAITARGLDPLVELILANLRSDDSFPWSEHAAEVFQALDLQVHWHLLCRKADSPAVRGRYARQAARHALSFVMPAMHEATRLLEEGVWVAPDPSRMTLVVDPRAEARSLLRKLEAALA